MKAKVSYTVYQHDQSHQDYRQAVNLEAGAVKRALAIKNLHVRQESLNVAALQALYEQYHGARYITAIVVGLEITKPTRTRRVK
jgi:hypothetical protein